MKAIFITGTDTGVGKTVITGYLARYLSEKGYSVITQKWIQTGSALPEDINTHFALMGRSKESIKEFLPHIAPYVFKPACSPHLAAKIGNKRISAAKIKKSFRILSRKFYTFFPPQAGLSINPERSRRIDFVIVEGAGGALVPFTGQKLIVDIVRELGLPALVVVGNKLGAINHALLTIEALKSRRIKIIGLVFNTIGKSKRYILEDNPGIIKKLSGQKVLGIFPHGRPGSGFYKKFIPIGRGILKSWTGG